jgi:hypothetical protein
MFMCYSHFGNGVRNGAISITQRGFISDYFNVNAIIGPHMKLKCIGYTLEH